MWWTRRRRVVVGFVVGVLLVVVVDDDGEGSEGALSLLLGTGFVMRAEMYETICLERWVLPELGKPEMMMSYLGGVPC